MDIVELIYRPADRQGHTKCYEFSRTTMRTRWAQGLLDARATLLASPWLVPMPPEVGARTFDMLKDHQPRDTSGLVHAPMVRESADF
jgi:NTE family protein